MLYLCISVKYLLNDNHLCVFLSGINICLKFLKCLLQTTLFIEKCSSSHLVLNILQRIDR